MSTLDLRPNNLPTETSAFVGREAELRAIRERLDDGDARLLTLTGPGGTGKTRLAIRAAADQIDRFTDGVYLVDLVTATDAEAVVALTAAAVGLAETVDRSPLDELRRRLRGQRVLLVLDNFEQVTVAAPILLELLANCPNLKILVTSRQALRIRGEHVISVPPLTLPSTAARTTTASEMSQFEAIQLFVERARAVRSDFRLTDDNAAAVTEICRRLDGLPLAIELATARLNLFSPEALRDRLANSLKALGTGPRDLPARQQTLRATIEWSYQLLGPSEQRLFELLSVFAGGSVEAIEAVSAGLDEAAGTPLDALDGLGSLLDKSLVSEPAGSDGDGATRVAMLKTIKGYATERLDAQPEFAAAAHEAHARYYVQLAVDTSAGSDEEPGGGASADRLAGEIDNLRIAWRHSVDRRELSRLWALRDPMWAFYDGRGWYAATIELINDLIGVVEATPDNPDRWQMEVKLRTTLARAMTLESGYSDEAEDAYRAAYTIIKEHGNVPQFFPVLRNLGSFHGLRGEFAKGIHYANEILRLAETEDDASMRMVGYAMLGADTGFGGQLDEGLRHLDEAIRTFESTGFRSRQLRFGIDTRVSTLTTSGFFLWLQGYPDRAVERADRGVALAREIDHPYSLAYAYYHSGFLHLWRREGELVRDRAEAALEVATTTGLPVWQALSTCLLGAATSALGQPDEGIRRMSDGIDQYHGLRTPPVFWPMIRFMQAGAHVDGRSPEAGMTLVDDGLAIAGDDGVVGPLLHVVRGDLSLLAADADPAAATASFERAWSLAGSVGARMPQLRAAVRLCRCVSDAERADRLEALRVLHATFTEGSSTPDLQDATELLAPAAG